jgi:hypothetical protein
MTELQAVILFTAVQTSKTGGMIVLPSRQLALHLPPEWRRGAGAVANHLKRLAEDHCCLQKRGRGWRIDPGLVTESESSQYLLALRHACRTDPFKILISEFHQIPDVARWGEETLTKILRLSIDTGYVAQTQPVGFIRPGARTTELLLYIERLANGQKETTI